MTSRTQRRGQTQRQGRIRRPGRSLQPLAPAILSGTAACVALCWIYTVYGFSPVLAGLARFFQRLPRQSCFSFYDAERVEPIPAHPPGLLIGLLIGCLMLCSH